MPRIYVYTVLGHCPLCASRKEGYVQSLLEVTSDVEGVEVFVCTGCRTNTHTLRFPGSRSPGDAWCRSLAVWSQTTATLALRESSYTATGTLPPEAAPVA